MFGCFRVHNADPHRWAQLHGIEPFDARCSECGRALELSVPIASKTLRGLACPPCECGNASTPYCVVGAKGGDVLGALGGTR